MLQRLFIQKELKIKNTYIFRILFSTILVAILSSWTNNYPSQKIDTNAKMKAMFIYGFTKNVEWPKSYKEGNFIIGVLGSSHLFPELHKIASNYMAGNQPFEIKSFASASEVGKCHMLIVPPNHLGDLNEIIEKIRNSSTLLVTEKPGLAKQGAAINFVIQNNKQAFELNRKNAEKYNLKVSSSLTTLAVNTY